MLLHMVRAGPTMLLMSAMLVSLGMVVVHNDVVVIVVFVANAVMPTVLVIGHDYNGPQETFVDCSCKMSPKICAGNPAWRCSCLRLKRGSECLENGRGVSQAGKYVKLERLLPLVESATPNPKPHLIG